MGTKLIPIPRETRLIIRSKLSSCMVGSTRQPWRCIHECSCWPVFERSSISNQLCFLSHSMRPFAFGIFCSSVDKFAETTKVNASSNRCVTRTVFGNRRGRLYREWPAFTEPEGSGGPEPASVEQGCATFRAGRAFRGSGEAFVRALGFTR